MSGTELSYAQAYEMFSVLVDFPQSLPSLRASELEKEHDAGARSTSRTTAWNGPLATHKDRPKGSRFPRWNERAV